jgi:hypothetical protein
MATNPKVLYYPESADSDPCALVRVAYAKGYVGFCLTRAAIVSIAASGSPEAKKQAKELLDETANIQPEPNVPDNAYLYPVSPSHQEGAAKYFWENRSDPSLIRTILEMGAEAGHLDSKLDVEYVRLLPGEECRPNFNPFRPKAEGILLIFPEEVESLMSTSENEEPQKIRQRCANVYWDHSRTLVVYAQGTAGFTLSRMALQIMASLGSSQARQVLLETETESQSGSRTPEDRFYYPVSVHSHTGAAEYFWKHRSDEYLVQVVQELGSKAGHPNSKLRVQRLRLLPNEMYKVEYACPVGYGYQDDEHIKIWSFL